uniref:Coiled-coil-helix-coiled-coil-helix domain-containing protein 1 n=1 Tax=Schistocephalus solidus TaxID=70667 RepID=A0A0X3PA19_SCHSO
MRVTEAMSKMYKRSTNKLCNLEYFKYKYYRDPILKNQVSGKGEKEPRAVCVEEMLLMLACLKTNDFEEKPCSQLIDTFNICVRDAEARRRRSKEERKQGIFTSAADDESSRISSVKINRILRKFPEP